MVISSQSVCFPATIGELAQEFIISCRSRSLSPRTIKRYLDHLELLGYEDQASITPAQIEVALTRYSQHSPSSINSYLRVWKTFFRWVAVRYETLDPSATVKGVREPRIERRVFTHSDMAKLWAAAQNRRDRAFLMLAMDTGARIGEIARLRRQDVQGGFVRLNSLEPDRVRCAHCVELRSKSARGGKTGERTVPISKATSAMLAQIGDAVHIWTSVEITGLRQSRAELIVHLREQGHTYRTICETVKRVGFPRISDVAARKTVLRNGISKLPRRPLGATGLMTRWRRMVERSGISGLKTGPHTLRHTFATAFLRGEGQIEILQKILGHSDISTTMHYVHMNMDDVAAGHRAAKVVDRMIPQPTRNANRLRTSLSPAQRRRIRLSNNGRCVECGEKATTVDHTLPLSMGGRHSQLNLRPLCALCNVTKASRLVEGMWRTVPALSDKRLVGSVVH